MIGDDAFSVVWMAKAVSNGWYDVWFIHPASFFGYYPFSPYAFGAIFFLSLFFRFNLGIDVVVIVFSFITMATALITSYYLGNVLFPESETKRNWFMIMFSLSPLFLDLTYFTSNLRGPFLAFLPVPMCFMFKMKKSATFNDIRNFFFALLALSMIHSLTIFYLIYLIPFIVIWLFSKYRVGIKNDRYTPFLIILSYLVAFFGGVFFLGISGYIHPLQLLLKTNELTITNIILLILQYGTKLGITGFFCIIGFFYTLIHFKGKEDSGDSQFFIILGILLVFISPRVDYAILFIYPWICYYGVIGLSSFQMRISKKQFEILSILILSGFFAQSVGLSALTVTTIILFFLLSLILITTLLIELLNKEMTYHLRTKPILSFIFILTVLITAITPLENRESDLPFEYISEHEISIADYLERNNMKNDLVISFNHKIARRISAFGFQPVIPTYNPPSILYYNLFDISKESIRELTRFEILNILKDGSPFKYNETLSTLEYYKYYLPLIELNVSNQEEYYQLLASGIRYVITYNSIEDVTIPEIIKERGLLFDSIMEKGVLRLNTGLLSLYEVFY